jgi:hypoxanthine phosphoribosyltransferase
VTIQGMLRMLQRRKIDHIPIRTSSRVHQDQKSEADIHGLKYIPDHAFEGCKILIVDDVFDSGKTFAALDTYLTEKMQVGFEVRYAAIDYKPKNRKVELVPNYYLHETDAWLVYPHELDDETDEELYVHYGIDPETGTFTPTFQNYIAFVKTSQAIWTAELQKEWYKR